MVWFTLEAGCFPVCVHAGLEVGVTDGELTLTVNVCKFSINLLKVRRTNSIIQRGSKNVAHILIDAKSASSIVSIC